MEIDGVHAQVFWCEGQPIAVINAWDIAIGRGWIEKAEEWARQHGALLYDTELPVHCGAAETQGGYDEAALAAFARGYVLVVVRQFNVRD